MDVANWSKVCAHSVSAAVFAVVVGMIVPHVASFPTRNKSASRKHYKNFTHTISKLQTILHSSFTQLGKSLGFLAHTLLSVLPRPFLQGAAPCPFLMTHCPF